MRAPRFVRSHPHGLPAFALTRNHSPANFRQTLFRCPADDIFGAEMPDEDLELFRLHRAEQSKYVYFILAAAAGGIAVAVRMTADATLQWSLAPLGAAVVSWGLSFYHGCRNLQGIQEVTAKNAMQLKMARGDDPVVGRDLALRAVAMQAW